MKNLIVVISILLMFAGCSSEADKQRAHERQMALIESGQHHNPYRQQYVYTPHQYSYADTMAVALAAGYVASAFTPSYAPVYRGGLYYDRNNVQISKTVYETRIVTVKENRAKHKKAEKAKLSKWKKDPKNSSKFKASKKKADTKYKAADKKKFQSGSKKTAAKNWSGSDKSKGWKDTSKKKPVKKTVKKANKPKPKKVVKRASKPRKVAKRAPSNSKRR